MYNDIDYEEKELCDELVWVRATWFAGLTTTNRRFDDEVEFQNCDSSHRHIYQKME